LIAIGKYDRINSSNIANEYRQFSKLTKVGSGAFHGCINLKQIPIFNQTVASNYESRKWYNKISYLYNDYILLNTSIINAFDTSSHALYKKINDIWYINNVEFGTTKPDIDKIPIPQQCIIGEQWITNKNNDNINGSIQIGNYIINNFSSIYQNENASLQLKLFFEDPGRSDNTGLYKLYKINNNNDLYIIHEDKDFQPFDSLHINAISGSFDVGYIKIKTDNSYGLVYMSKGRTIPDNNINYIQLNYVDSNKISGLINTKTTNKIHFIKRYGEVAEFTTTQVNWGESTITLGSETDKLYNNITNYIEGSFYQFNYTTLNPFECQDCNIKTCPYGVVERYTGATPSCAPFHENETCAQLLKFNRNDGVNYLRIVGLSKPSAWQEEINGVIQTTNLTLNLNDSSDFVDGEIYTVDFDEMSSAHVTIVRGKMSKIIIGNKIKNLYMNCFSSYYNLLEVDINSNQLFVDTQQPSSGYPDYGKSGMGVNSFSNCPKLHTIKLPQNLTIFAGNTGNNSLGNDSKGLFQNCTTLAEWNDTTQRGIDLSKITQIAEYTFKNTGFVELYLPNTTTIKEYAFAGCQNLVKIHLPNVNTLHKTAFNDCPNLETIIIPLISISNWPDFTGCTKLQRPSEGCDYGKYKYNQLCFSCDEGKFSGIDAVSCGTTCPVGFYKDNNKCLTCGSGKYSTNTNAIGESACQLCEPGKYQNEVAQQSCKNCGEGEYSTSGLSACLSCQPGEYPNSDKSSCTKCSPGKYSTDNKTIDCNLCDVGKYQDEEGKTSCKDCTDEVNYSDSEGSTSCTPCKVCNANEDITQFCVEKSNTVCELKPKWHQIVGATKGCWMPNGTFYEGIDFDPSDLTKCNYEDNPRLINLKDKCTSYKIVYNKDVLKTNANIQSNNVNIKKLRFFIDNVPLYWSGSHGDVTFDLEIYIKHHHSESIDTIPEESSLTDSFTYVYGGSHKFVDTGYYEFNLNQNFNWDTSKHLVFAIKHGKHNAYGNTNYSNGTVYGSTYVFDGIKSDAGRAWYLKGFWDSINFSNDVQTINTVNGDSSKYERNTSHKQVPLIELMFGCDHSNHVCTCPNGTPVSDVECATHGIQCKSCNSGYMLQDGKCIQKVCKCSNGLGTIGEHCENIHNQQCASCNDGYVLNDKVCEYNPCPASHPFLEKYINTNLYWCYEGPGNDGSVCRMSNSSFTAPADGSWGTNQDNCVL
tara:strand:+ start:3545 stop:7147 length:3603 start_codon:yes stop_codon:yes gene_type:complete